MKINDTMVYVYGLPNKLSDGFCFGVPKQIPFDNLDWFNGFDGMTEADLRTFIAKKRYVNQYPRLLVLSPDNDLAMILKREDWVL